MKHILKENIDNSQRIEWKYLCYGKNKTETKLLSILNNNYPTQTSWLDIGCGGGGLSRNFEKCIGIDINYDAIVKAREALHDRNTYICSDASQLPFKSNSINYFISNSMIEHMPDPLKALKEIYRVCRRGGALIIPCRDTFSFIYDPVNFLLLKFKRKTINFGAFGYGHCNVLTFQQWTDLIKKSGFQIKETIPFDTSVFTQFEFFCFSLLLSNRDYGNIPTKTISKRLYNFVRVFHRMIGVFDFNIKSAFSQCFIVNKDG